ncbi:hypothetical protein E2P81_ATG05857 [Venturia nashicola]|uniref:Uncharacterized protein n=1 Tax=Venturia nashicola TaxID=86259 RepID=A0A4Z1PCN5_9PEZI|nr:hypothetical protein E6O75_ATG06004 [Venturia nashicola]TLD29563.1 hypothetical protein E2P81_ATG05857 [Venturia nashicola]
MQFRNQKIGPCARYTGKADVLLFGWPALQYFGTSSENTNKWQAKLAGYGENGRKFVRVHYGFSIQANVDIDLSTK